MLETSGGTLSEKACSAARKINQCTSLSNIPGLCQISISHHHEVKVDNEGRMTYCNLDDYQKFFPQETWANIIERSKKVKEASKTILFFNSTPQGGGVAILRHATIRFYNLLSINAHWLVMKPNPDVFMITKKKFHNVLQGLTPLNIKLTPEDKHLYAEWCAENINRYWSYKDSPIYKADVIVFDDPQTAGLIPHIKQMNPKATLVYRSHIEIRSYLTAKSGSIYHDVWHYLWSFIRLSDIFISHPVEMFVPKEVKESPIRIKYMPATTDPCDGLNKVLDPYSIQYYQNLFNRIAVDQIGRGVNFKRSYFVQIARFDPSKGIPDLIDAYRLFRAKLAEQMTVGNRIATSHTHIPQLVITGHGSIDDPEGDTVYKHLMEKLNKIRTINSQDAQWVDDVIVVRLGPSDQMLNAILSGAMVAFQLSLREGFEIKVSEALLKGIPVVAYNSGGIALQIEEKKDGYLIERGDVAAVANAMYTLVTNSQQLKKLKHGPKNKQREWILTPSNILQWNYILLEHSN